MPTITTKTKKSVPRYSILPTPEERLSLLQSIKGMWERRKPDPIKELKKMRRERERKLPVLH